MSTIYKSSVLHLDVFDYKSPVYAIPGEAQFTQFILFVSVYFETGLFVLVVSMSIRNTETNRKTTETDCVSVLFGSNRKYFLFVSRTPYLAAKKGMILLVSHQSETAKI